MKQENLIEVAVVEWSKPEVEEILLSCEISSYCNAELDETSEQI